MQTKKFIIFGLIAAIAWKGYDWLFGCACKNYSFPMSTKAGHRRSGAAIKTGTYVVCLDCGKEFPYDWTKMKIVHIDSDIGVVYDNSGRIAGSINRPRNPETSKT